MDPRSWLSPNIWLLFSQLANAGFLGVQILLLVLPSSLSIIQDFVSEYVYTSLALLFTIGLVLQALTAGSQAHVLFYFYSRRAGLYMLSWSLCLVLLIIFPTDPGGKLETLPGIIHGLAVLVGILCLGLSIRETIKVTDFVPLDRLILGLIVAAFVFFVGIAFDIVGITERLFLIYLAITHHVLAQQLKF